MTQRERQILQWIEQDPMISQEALAECSCTVRKQATENKR